MFSFSPPRFFTSSNPLLRSRVQCVQKRIGPTTLCLFLRFFGRPRKHGCPRSLPSVSSGNLLTCSPSFRFPFVRRAPAFVLPSPGHKNQTGFVFPSYKATGIHFRAFLFFLTFSAFENLSLSNAFASAGVISGPVPDETLLFFFLRHPFAIDCLLFTFCAA